MSSSSSLLLFILTPGVSNLIPNKFCFSRSFDSIGTSLRQVFGMLLNAYIVGLENCDLIDVYRDDCYRFHRVL